MWISSVYGGCGPSNVLSCAIPTDVVRGVELIRDDWYDGRHAVGVEADDEGRQQQAAIHSPEGQTPRVDRVIFRYRRLSGRVVFGLLWTLCRLRFRARRDSMGDASRGATVHGGARRRHWRRHITWQEDSGRRRARGRCLRCPKTGGCGKSTTEHGGLLLAAPTSLVLYTHVARWCSAGTSASRRTVTQQPLSLNVLMDRLPLVLDGYRHRCSRPNL